MGHPHSRQALIDHVKQVFVHADGSQHEFFSAFLPAGSVRSLQSILAVNKFEASGDWHSGFGVGIEVGHGAGHLPDIQAACALMDADFLLHRAQDLVFFTFVIGNLSRAVRTKVDGQESLKEKVSISVHRVLEFIPESKKCVVSLNPAATSDASCELVPLVLSLNQLSATVMLDMWKWSQALDLTIRLANHVLFPAHLSPSVPEVLRQLSLSPGGTPEETFQDDNAKNVVDVLQSEGLIEGPPWTFTLKGKTSIECGVSITAEQRVVTRTEDTSPESSAILYQLIMELDHSGWQHMQCHSTGDVKVAKSKPYEHAHPESSKVWYTKMSKINQTASTFLRCSMPGQASKPSRSKQQHLQRASWS